MGKTTKQVAIADALSNQNSFNYLRHVAQRLPNALLGKMPVAIHVYQLCGERAKYTDGIAFSDLYRKFYLEVEKKLEALERLKKSKKLVGDDLQLYEELGNVVHEMIANQSDPIGITYGALSDIFASQKNQSIEDHVKRRAQQPFTIVTDVTHPGFTRDPLQPPLVKHGAETARNTINKQSRPGLTGHWWHRFKSVFAPSFKPQAKTSLATIRRKTWLGEDEEKQPKELRMGTQAQYSGFFRARVNPVFKRFLTKLASEETAASETGIDYVYFNNLSRDRPGLEGMREGGLAKALEALDDLEGDHPNIIVITLPAQGGLLKHSDLLKDPAQFSDDYKSQLEMNKIRNDFLTIAKGQSKQPDTNFYISERAKKLLYGRDGKSYNHHQEEWVLNELFKHSVKALGFEGKSSLSPAERQALFFHFVKFEVPNYIIDTIGPKYFNFACKDGIDRAGIGSAYYNLIKSIELGKPMSMQDFDGALHGPTCYVKARGVNEHLDILWNALAAYATANRDLPKGATWISDWLAQHTPRDHQHMCTSPNPATTKIPVADPIAAEAVPVPGKSTVPLAIKPSLAPENTLTDAVTPAPDQEDSGPKPPHLP